MKCPQVTVTVCGRWVRLYVGITFKRKLFRLSTFADHRLVAMRLWRVRHPDYTGHWRIVGIQTRPAYVTDRRFRAWA